MTIGQDYELIFVNDGSTDRSLKVLNDLRAKVDCHMDGYLIVNQKNSGVSTARNEGLKHAKGDYIWFVAPDDMVAPQSLAWADDELKKNPQLKVIRYYNRRVPENIDSRELLNQQYTPELPQTATAYSLIVNRKHLMDNCISFNPKMAYGEDTLWVFEVNFLAGDDCVGDGGKVNYFYRIRQGSAMRSRNAQARERHLSSMEAMLGVYEQILSEKRDLLTEKQQKHLQKRIDWSVQNVLFDALIGTTREEQGLIYGRVANRQQSLNWGKISPRYGIKNLIVNLVGLPLKYQPYYRVMGWIFSKIKK